jgi:hypothetical protein
MSDVQAEVQTTQEATQQPLVNILKLVSGEEVITQIAVEKLENGQELIHLVNPYAVVRQFGEDGKVGIAIVPLADLTANGSVQVSTSAVVYTAVPNDEFLQHYNEKVNPPLIQTPPEKKLIVPNA